LVGRTNLTNIYRKKAKPTNNQQVEYKRILFSILKVFSRSAFLALLDDSDSSENDAFNKYINYFKEQHRHKSLNEFLEDIRYNLKHMPSDLNCLKYMLFTYTRPYRIETLIQEHNKKYKKRKVDSVGEHELTQMLMYLDITSFKTEKESLSQISHKIKTDSSFDILIIGFPGKDTWKRIYQIKHTIDRIQEKDSLLKGKVVILLGMYTAKDFVSKEQRTPKLNSCGINLLC